MSEDTDVTIHVVRNEVDPSHEYHCDALADRFPEAETIDYPDGERVPIGETDGVVLTGSTAGVYESNEYDWIAEQETLVRDLVEREIPLLGVCFGHQIVNTALGGVVEHVGTEAALVEAELATDPIFADVDPVVVSLHGDEVIEVGEGLEVIAAADHAPLFGTRHRSAPVRTVQFHPEITADLRQQLLADFQWEEREFSFEDVHAESVFENFRKLVNEHRDRRSPD